MTISLCVLLWPHDGTADALVEYEGRVLALVGERDRVVARTEMMNVSVVR